MVWWPRPLWLPRCPAPFLLSWRPLPLLLDETHLNQLAEQLGRVAAPTATCITCQQNQSNQFVCIVKHIQNDQYNQLFVKTG